MAYTFEGTDDKPEVPKGSSAYPFRFYPRKDGARVEPASGTITLKAPGGAALVTAAAMTKEGAGVTAFLSYTLDASNTALWPSGRNYSAEITWTAQGGATAEPLERIMFDVVLVPLPVPIDDNDLLEVEPNLAAILKQADASLTKADRFIRRAWSSIKRRLESAGARPALVISRHLLVEPAIYLTLHFVYWAASRGRDDVNLRRSRDMLDRFKEAWEALPALEYDADDDGAIDEARRTVTGRLWRPY